MNDWKKKIRSIRTSDKKVKKKERNQALLTELNALRLMQGVQKELLGGKGELKTRLDGETPIIELLWSGSLATPTKPNQKEGIFYIRVSARSGKLVVNRRVIKANKDALQEALLKAAKKPLKSRNVPTGCAYAFRFVIEAIAELR